MSLKRIFTVATAIAAVACAVAQDNTKVQAPAKAPATPAQPPKPKFDVDELLKLVPDFLGEYTVDGKVVKVDSAMLKAGLKSQLQMAAMQGADIKPEMLKQAIGRMTEGAVMERVLPLVAAKAGVKADTAKLKSEIAEFKKNQLNNDEAQFKKFLESQGCKTEDELVAKIAPQQAIQDYIKSIQDAIVISDAEIKKYYDAHAAEHKFYTCSHILAAFNPADPRGKSTPEQDAAALKKIKEIQDKLAKGAKFEDLAKEFSDCPSGKSAGGKLQDYDPEKKMPQGQMVQEFTDAFNALKPGETTKEPVKTQFGYHIIKASPVVVRTLADETPTIKGALVNEAMQKKIPALIEQIKKDYKIKMYDVK